MCMKIYTCKNLRLGQFDSVRLSAPVCPTSDTVFIASSGSDITRTCARWDTARPGGDGANGKGTSTGWPSTGSTWPWPLPRRRRSGKGCTRNSISPKTKLTNTSVDPLSCPGNATYPPTIEGWLFLSFARKVRDCIVCRVPPQGENGQHSWLWRTVIAQLAQSHRAPAAQDPTKNEGARNRAGFTSVRRSRAASFLQTLPERQHDEDRSVEQIRRRVLLVRSKSLCLAIARRSGQVERSYLHRRNRHISFSPYLVEPTDPLFRLIGEKFLKMVS